MDIFLCISVFLIGVLGLIKNYEKIRSWDFFISLLTFLFGLIPLANTFSHFVTRPGKMRYLKCSLLKWLYPYTYEMVMDKLNYEDTAPFCNQFFYSPQFHNTNTYVTFDKVLGEMHGAIRRNFNNIDKIEFELFDSYQINFFEKDKNTGFVDKYFTYDKESNSHSKYALETFLSKENSFVEAISNCDHEWALDWTHCHINMSASVNNTKIYIHMELTNDILNCVTILFSSKINPVEIKVFESCNDFSKLQCAELLKCIAQFVKNPTQGVCTYNLHYNFLGKKILHTLSIQDCVKEIKNGKKLKRFISEQISFIEYHGRREEDEEEINRISVLCKKFIIDLSLKTVFGDLKNSLLFLLEKYNVEKEFIIHIASCKKASSLHFLRHLTNYKKKRFFIDIEFLTSSAGIKKVFRTDRSWGVSSSLLNFMYKDLGYIPNAIDKVKSTKDEYMGDDFCSLFEKSLEGELCEEDKIRIKDLYIIESTLMNLNVSSEEELYNRIKKMRTDKKEFFKKVRIKILNLSLDDSIKLLTERMSKINSNDSPIDPSTKEIEIQKCKLNISIVNTLKKVEGINKKIKKAAQDKKFVLESDLMDQVEILKKKANKTINSLNSISDRVRSYSEVVKDLTTFKVECEDDKEKKEGRKEKGKELIPLKFRKYMKECCHFKMGNKELIEKSMNLNHKAQSSILNFNYKNFRKVKEALPVYKEDFLKNKNEINKKMETLKKINSAQYSFIHNNYYSCLEKREEEIYKMERELESDEMKMKIVERTLNDRISWAIMNKVKKDRKALFKAVNSRIVTNGMIAPPKGGIVEQGIEDLSFRKYKKSKRKGRNQKGGENTKIIKYKPQESNFISLNKNCLNLFKSLISSRFNRNHKELFHLNLTGQGKRVFKDESGVILEKIDEIINDNLKVKVNVVIQEIEEVEKSKEEEEDPMMKFEYDNCSELLDMDIESLFSR